MSSSVAGLSHYGLHTDDPGAANARVKNAFEAEAKKDGPELAFLETKLGLSIEGKPRKSPCANRCAGRAATAIC